MSAAFWSSPGVWMAAGGGGLMLVNAVRALTDARGFAAYLGLPLADPADGGLVRVYGLRALFLAILVALMLATQARQALFLLAAAAVIMPLGGAALAAKAGAPRRTVLRHAAIAAFLLVTALLLGRTV